MRDALSRAPLTPAEVAGLIEDPDRITLVAQPIVDARRGVVAGYELLSRFRLEQPAPPDHVFAEAMRHGLADRLEAAVVTHALALAEHRPRNTFVTVNVDPRQLRSRAVLDALEKARSLSGVVIELTEHGEPDDLDALREALRGLRAQGALSAIDDAGAGYSGLKQILELQPQFLKIDRDLVTNLHTNEAKRALVQMLGELAARLDAWVIAEGIEHEAELVVLQRLGVPLVQGWFLGRPAAPWAELRNEAFDILAGRTSLPSVQRQVGDVLEPCPIVADGAWPDAPIAVALQEDRRIAALRVRSGGVPMERGGHEVMTVHQDTPLSAAALRAATRPEPVRWDPLVGVDDLGCYLGVVSMQRLVCALAASEEPERTPLRRLSLLPAPGTS